MLRVGGRCVVVLTTENIGDDFRSADCKHGGTFFVPTFVHVRPPDGYTTCVCNKVFENPKKNICIPTDTRTVAKKSKRNESLLSWAFYVF